jgi:hypothetical protein
MLRSQAVARAQRILGFTTAHETALIEQLQDAQQEFEQDAELPWFLRREISSVSTTIDEERVQVPPDFLREVEEDALYYFDPAADDADKYTTLVKEELAFLRGDLPGTGSPSHYALDGIYFRVFPTPDEVYTLKMIYYAKDALLTTDIENDWLKYLPTLMIGRAGQVVAASTRNPEAVVEFKRLESLGLGLLIRGNVARAAAGRTYVMGGKD